MPNIYGGNIGAIADALLSGRGHFENLGDSQSTPALDYVFWDAFPQMLHSRVRPHYMVVSGQNAAQVAGANSTGYASSGSPTTADNATTYDKTYYEDAAAAQLTARIMGPCRVHAYTANVAADTIIGNGITLSRQQATAITHSNANRSAPHATSAGNGGEPWFHNTYMKGKLVYWVPTTAANNLDELGIAIIRQGLTGGGTNTSARTQHVNSSGADVIAATAYSAALTDGGGYQTDTGGIVNDHDVSLQLRSASAGTYAETGKVLIPLAGVFARCDSGGTIPTNADGSYCAYSSIGRGGSRVSSWLNYCTQTDWQRWFAATMEGAAPTFIDCYTLGHNIASETIDVGDGDGAVAEYAGSTLNSVWKKRYKALMARRKAAFLAAFPSGNYIGPLVIVPWTAAVDCGTYSGNSTRTEALNTAAKEAAVESNGGYISLIDYFRASDGTLQAPFTTLHPWTPANGHMISLAIMDCLDRNTSFRYSAVGRTSGSRGGILSRIRTGG